MWHQQILTLSAKPRGFHLVTAEILGNIPAISQVNTGLLHLLLQHTSASLTLNENCDPTVRGDMERHFLRTVPDQGNYEHDYEGADDMPSHIKSSLLGVSLALPVQRGRVLLGTWQGIWLGEHRIHGGARRIAVTLQGEPMP
ncbi:secondary thiamine-phosphate synthase enzyme YjbQ [Mangrovibacter yixingensis]|uniref:secondary thiamine-phosphate synthase enzyme YjbQ n=1 Tax=Mangrovibacter yixingensis TaxID=1529639 RepID=UPI001CFDACD2|nr:secondary thiamine-phosphate synthase enzyme YjbQ [Mangrovibacter yixingensis]